MNFENKIIFIKKIFFESLKKNNAYYFKLKLLKIGIYN